MRVLDPACGSGNFLYVSLKQLLDLEKEVSTFASKVGLIRNPLKECPIADGVTGANGPLIVLSGAAVFSHASSVTRK